MENICIKPVWPKSKDEIWAERFEPLGGHGIRAEGIEPLGGHETRAERFEPLGGHETRVERLEPLGNRNEKKGLARRLPVWAYVRRLSAWTYAAAVFIPVFLVACFYTVTENTARGEHAVVQLPDRSTVTLNAESKLSYKPLAWLVQRKVTLEGEAFFEVKKGSRFCVRSGDKRVNVLGTTFNVYARTSMYRVTCLTGQVEVCVGRETAVLHPNMQVAFREQIDITENVAHAAANGWMQGKFVFVETPLSEVIAEVERQYNIHVASEGDYDPNHLLSGNFSKTGQAEELLEIIGKPFGIKFSIE